LNIAAANIRTIIFDLDGTLYTSEPFAALIQQAGCDYMAGVLGISDSEARELMVTTRRRLQDQRGTAQTLSTICTELGGNVQDLHAFFTANLRPEAYLLRDERVIACLAKLAARYELYLYTNNNRALTTRIMTILGFEPFFTRIYTIDDNWIAKPNDQAIDRLLGESGLKPEQALFVGDRYDIDLRLPEQRGCPVYLTQSTDQLLRLESALSGER